MINTKPTRTLLAASFLSWFVLLALPFVNGQIHNGTDWVQLCTQSGLKLVPIDAHADDTAHSLDCPCLGQTLASAEFTHFLTPFNPLATDRLPNSHIPLTTQYLLPPLRAPPVA